MYNLSIIIPHFNSSVLLKKLLRSIPVHKDIEVLVIDDKSTKEELRGVELLQKKGSINFKLLINDSLKGAGSCRNIGIRHAKGKWLLFADSDDYFTKHFYPVVSPYFASPNDVVFFRPSSVLLGTEEPSDRHIRFCMRLDAYVKNKCLENELALRYRLDPPWSKLISKKFIVENSIAFEEVVASNDLLFSAKVGYSMNVFEISKETIYIVTKNFDSLTVNINEIIYDIRFKEKVKYYDYLKSRLTTKELVLLNLSFLDFLYKSSRYGLKKFLKTLKYIFDNKLPTLDRRVLRIGTLVPLLSRTITHIIRDKKYHHTKKF